MDVSQIKRVVFPCFLLSIVNVKFDGKLGAELLPTGPGCDLNHFHLPNYLQSSQRLISTFCIPSLKYVGCIYFLCILTSTVNIVISFCQSAHFPLFSSLRYFIGVLCLLNVVSSK